MVSVTSRSDVFNKPNAVDGLIAALGAIAGLTACMGIAFFPTTLAIGTLLVAGFVYVLVAPLRCLPASALVAACLVPVRALPVPEVANVLTPALLLMGLWGARKVLADGRSSLRSLDAPAFVGGLFVAYCLLVTVPSGFRGNGLVWTTSLVVCALLPLVLKVSQDEVAPVVRAWLWLGLLLGLFAVIEFALQSNPILGELYASAPFPVEQKWATYRVTTTLGHPLTNSVFFVVALAVGLAQFARNRSRVAVVSAVVSAVALFLTQSRGGLLAAAVVFVLFVAMTFLLRGSRGLVGRVSLLAAATGAIVLISQNAYVLERITSQEASSSRDQRILAYDVALNVAERYYWLGSGAGSSAPATRGLGAPTLVIESSFLQLLVSVGLLGVLLFIATCAAIVWRAVQGKQWEVFLAIVAYVVSIATFNFIEANRSMHVLLGSILIMAALNSTSSAELLRPHGPQPNVDSDESWGNHGRQKLL